MEFKPLKPENKLGFGLMRLPVMEDKKTIDHDRLCQMVDAFIAGGGTYFDTAYFYHEYTSEAAARKALVERYPRSAYTLATKLPAVGLKAGKTPDELFAEQLANTGLEYFDYYLLHAVSTGHLPLFEGGAVNCFEWGWKLKEAGKCRYFGFSFHDTAEVLDRLLSQYKVDFVQLQINYLDWDNDMVQSRACYEVAVKHGVPVVVMEPVKGGALANVPAEAEAIMKAKDPAASPASWALRYVASLDNVMAVLSGMSTEEQMADNIATFSPFKPLTAEEADLMAQVQKAMLSKPTVGCTACRYCTEGCPQNIPIPDVISTLNNATLYGCNGVTVARYNSVCKDMGKASMCIDCGHCTEVCPQHLEIPKHMKEAAALFEK